MDAASILSSSTPVTVTDEGSATESGQANEAAQATEAANIVAKAEGLSPAPQEPQKTELVSPRLAMLAKEERRLQEERKRLAEERKNPEFQEFLEWKKIKAKAKEDPFTYLEKAGLSYDELTEYVISGKHTKDPSIRVLEEKLARIEKEKEEAIKREKEERESNQLNTFKEQIRAECLKDADTYELVNVWGAHNLVYNVIQEHYDKTEEVLPIQEAAKKVEAYLEEESKKYQGSKKLRRLFGAPDIEANKEAANKEAEITSPAAKMSATLSNSATNSATSTTDEDEIDPHLLVQKAAKLLMR